MGLEAMGELHLCLGAPNPMDIFGGAWVGYMDKLTQNLSMIQPEDTTVILGDLSWALSLNEAKEDFAWIDQIPGRKVILKGNHDYWWNTATKFYNFCKENSFSNQFILNNNHYVVISEINYNHIRILDPRQGVKHYTYPRFIHNWYKKETEKGIIILFEKT